MALHRDIYWIGRQWAVTGHGLQVVDQRLAGAFDIEISRLGGANLLENVRQMPRFNQADFAKAFAVASDRFSVTLGNPTALALEQSTEIQVPPPAQPPSSEIRLCSGPQPTPAKFLPQWRIRR